VTGLVVATRPHRPDDRRSDSHDRVTPEEIKKHHRTIIEASEVRTLVLLRERTGRRVGEALVDVGQVLHVTGNIVGTGRVDGSSKRGNGDDETVAVGALLQVGGELTLGAVHLFALGQNYAGAALLRQLVEVEYLMWAFTENPKDAKKWLDSTPPERQKFFRPVVLRRRSRGRFLDKDYGHHCEMGGHPVPRSMTLLGKADPAVVQLLVVDILLHGWRTADSAVQWSVQKGLGPMVGGTLAPARSKLTAWGKRDPLYTLGPSPV